MKGKVLVTGAGGFVGRALSQKLAAKKKDLRLAVMEPKFRFSGAQVMRGDLNDPAYCRRILKGVDTVYYLAGFKKNLGVHLGEPFTALAGNVSPLLAFLSAAKDSGVKQIIYTSSVIALYATDPEAALDGYMWGKYLNEIVLRAFSAETKIPVKIIRSAAVYGPGNDIDPKTANVIPSLIDKIYRAEDKISIWGSGERQLQFVYIDDLVQNLMAAERAAAGEYTVGHQAVITINELVKTLLSLMKKDLDIERDLSKPDKATKLADFNNLSEPKFDLARGLAATIKDYLCRKP